MATYIITQRDEDGPWYLDGSIANGITPLSMLRDDARRFLHKPYADIIARKLNERRNTQPSVAWRMCGPFIVREVAA